jgi:secreted Zn-dependent insulinase-like peptidase
MLRRKSNPFSYYCLLAGLQFDITLETDGLLLSFKGYNDKISTLVGKILPLLTPSGFMELSTFDKSLESVSEGLHNSVFDLTTKYF